MFQQVKALAGNWRIDMNIDLNNLPEEVTVDVYLLVHDEYDFLHVSQYAKSDGYTCIAGPVPVTFVTNDRDKIIRDAVASLRKAIQTIRADAELKCNAIEEKIQGMLALPNLEKDGE